MDSLCLFFLLISLYFLDLSYSMHYNNKDWINIRRRQTMIQSMTGFGRGEAANEKYKITIEMKSVNHRYLDVSVRLPRKLNYFETVIRNQIKEFAGRGKVDVFVNFENLEGSSGAIRYNPDVASAYLMGIRQIATDFDVEEHTDAYHLSRFPEVFTMEEEDMDEEMLLGLITEAMQAAGNKFTESRCLEGEKLCQDILGKLDYISSLVDEIVKRSPQMVEEYRQKLTEKVQQLLGDTKLDENVLATELVIYSDKVCVDEEMVRLRTHILHMKETLSEGERIGRKLDFLIQEMNREANTTLSKANDIDISNYGIELKTEIEKIREQIQNIE